LRFLDAFFSLGIIYPLGFFDPWLEDNFLYYTPNLFDIQRMGIAGRLFLRLHKILAEDNKTSRGLEGMETRLVWSLHSPKDAMDRHFLGRANAKRERNKSGRAFGE
jgi:hypothetical protein